MSNLNLNDLQGPWVVNDERNLPDGGIFVEDRLGVVAIVTNEENAPLIAAAPELLEALNKLVKLHHDWDKGSAYVQVSFYEKNKVAITEARAAIAKATGQ